MRRRRCRRPAALAAVSPRRRRSSSTRSSSASSVPRIDSMTKLRLPFLIDQGTAASKQVIAWQDGAQERAQRCGALSAQRAEAAHLNSQVGAPICDAVVAERRRAASDGVGEPSRARARRRHTFGPSPWHGYMCGPCHCRGPHVTRGRARAAEGPPACSPLKRRVCFASPPYSQYLRSDTVMDKD